MDAIREQAAVNWVSLVQYFSTRQHSASRALYQRVIRSYTKGGDHLYALYAEYAWQALNDMDILALDRIRSRVWSRSQHYQLCRTAGTPSREGIELKPDHPPGSGLGTGSYV
jgi:hypothetical protein